MPVSVFEKVRELEGGKRGDGEHFIGKPLIGEEVEELKEAFGRKVDLRLPPNESARPEYARVLERTKKLIFDDPERCYKTYGVL